MCLYLCYDMFYAMICICIKCFVVLGHMTCLDNKPQEYVLQSLGHMTCLDSMPQEFLSFSRFRVMIYPTSISRQRTQMGYHVLFCDLTYLDQQTEDLDGFITYYGNKLMAINIIVLCFYDLHFYVICFTIYVL